jgi:enterochelin esterase-like enzyme
VWKSFAAHCTSSTEHFSTTVFRRLQHNSIELIMESDSGENRTGGGRSNVRSASSPSTPPQQKQQQKQEQHQQQQAITSHSELALSSRKYQE